MMVTRMTENGVSTCRAAGTEQFEKFQTGFGRRKRTLVQYDYRASDGELFSCVAPTLEEMPPQARCMVIGKGKKGGRQ